MVVSAGAFALVYLGADGSTPVLQIAHPVAAGQALTAADVRVVRGVVRAGQDVDVLAGSDLSQVVGRTAAVPLTRGSLLAGSQLGPAAWPPDGQAVVAVPMKPGRLAAGVTAGSRVLVIPVAGQNASPNRETPKALTSAVVVSVSTDGDGVASVVVSLLVTRQDAVTVAASAADLSIALAQG